MRSLVFATRYAATPMACTAVLYRPTTSPPHRDREVYALIVWRMLDSQYAFSTMSKSATLSLNPVPRVCTQSSSFSAPRQVVLASICCTSAHRGYIYLLADFGSPRRPRRIISPGVSTLCQRADHVNYVPVQWH
jgi:hypothetical protein